MSYSKRQQRNHCSRFLPPLIKTLPTSTINIHNIVQFLKASIPLMEVRYNAKNASKSVFSKTPIYFVFEREATGR